MTTARFEHYRTRDGGYGFRLRAGNGEIVAGSEAYTRKTDAVRGQVDLVACVVEAAPQLVRDLLEHDDEDGG